jgi:hypothetical protein
MQTNRYRRAVSSFLLRGLLVLAGLCGGQARGDDFYYLLVFGSQEVPPRPKYTHTFAVFVHATGQGPCAANYQLEAATISWLPQTLDIRLAALLPECGRNLGLHETLRYVLGSGERVSLWGPYQIEPELYYRGLAQVALLQSGQVEYKAIDTGYPSSRVSNCIHAVSSVADGYRLHVLSPSWGETASYYVTRRMCPWIIDPGRRHPWVAERLGLGCYPIIYRELENPRSGPIRGPLSAALGRDRPAEAISGYCP